MMDICFALCITTPVQKLMADAKPIDRPAIFNNFCRIIEMPNEAVEKPLEGSQWRKFGGASTFPNAEIVGYGPIVKVGFLS